MVINLSLTSVDLQASDYYQQELEYEQRIEAQNNFALAQHKVTIGIDGQVVFINMSAIPNLQEVEGSIYFFRPNNAQQDIVFPIRKNDDQNGLYSFPASQFQKGKYEIEVSYTQKGKSYFVQKVVFI